MKSLIFMHFWHIWHPFRVVSPTSNDISIVSDAIGVQLVCKDDQPLSPKTRTLIERYPAFGDYAWVAAIAQEPFSAVIALAWHAGHRNELVR